MKISPLIDGLKTLSNNVKKALGKKKGMNLERRLCERRFIELEAMSGRIQRVKKKWWLK